MNDLNDHDLRAQLARLTELVARRFDRIEERLNGLDRDNGEIIGMLIALKAGLDGTLGDLAAEVAALDDADEPDDDAQPGHFLN
ncbi:hypothetical protein HL658_10255 [Azospirillum sp. RWY-5-1]|uniref:SlyX protein n=1 Tax=Azospirillum oleiclasticum TaxID=2735135 RepID=A0ABX2TAX6_9PROT|nr:hypothetical protein [Azospirillum oleiclasticum]NYZ12935.1 hypothetical protein [Azospirillum oleiclasticum]NYZ20392.1 hypothetical protein [Azospirillum oleiclasticum]